MTPKRCCCILGVAMFLNGEVGTQIVWQRVWGPQPVSVNALAVNSRGDVLAGTSGVMGTGRGIVRSTDGGGIWQFANTGLPDTNVHCLTRSTSGTLLAGTSKWWNPSGSALYRSTNHGDSWARADSGLSAAGIVLSLGAGPGGELYAGPGSGLRGVFRSTDDGETWFPTAGFDDRGGVDALLVNSSGVVFAGQPLVGVYRSTNQGATWTECNDGLTNRFVRCLARGGGDTVYAGTGYGNPDVFRSPNGGGAWARMNLNSTDVWTLATTAGAVFAGTSHNGVFLTTDAGLTWVRQDSGMGLLTVRSLLVTPAGYLFAGTDSGGIYRSIQPVVSHERVVDGIPASATLFQNYPNPFNPTTTITYEIPVGTQHAVSLHVFDVLGREVATLVNEVKEPGVYTVQWDASEVSSGVYFYRLKAGGFVETKRMLLLR